MYKAAQNHKKIKALIISTPQTANNTDIQPDIFQNPVLIFLKEQFKAHENIFVRCYKENRENVLRISKMKNTNE